MKKNIQEVHSLGRTAGTRDQPVLVRDHPSGEKRRATDGQWQGDNAQDLVIVIVRGDLLAKLPG